MATKEVMGSFFSLAEATVLMVTAEAHPVAAVLAEAAVEVDVVVAAAEINKN